MSENVHTLGAFKIMHSIPIVFSSPPPVPQHLTPQQVVHLHLELESLSRTRCSVQVEQNDERQQPQERGGGGGDEEHEKRGWRKGGYNR